MREFYAVLGICLETCANAMVCNAMCCASPYDMTGVGTYVSYAYGDV